MRSRALLTAVVGVFVAFGLTACGDDDGTGPEGDMTQDEAREVARAVTQQLGFLGFAGIGGASVQPDLRFEDGTANQTVDFDFEQSCPGGGTVGFSGTVSGDQTSTTLDADIDYNDCTQTPDQRTVTLNTTPVFDMTSTFEVVSETEFQMNSDLAGGFDWDIEGKTGSCSLDLTSDLTVTVASDGSSATVSVSTTGQICGQQIDESFESTVSTS